MTNVEHIWQNLKAIQYIETHTEYQYGGATGLLRGSITRTEIKPDILIFEERGIWQNQTLSLNMRNCFQWQLLHDDLTLSHLRFGPNHPVLLAKFMLNHNHQLFTTESPHHCAQDTYTAHLKVLNNGIIYLDWHITGPTKQGLIHTIYSPAPTS
ncbi:MAG: hypothetical protein Tsb005_15130 [Gammaproteobacteria bacterium]